MTLADLLGSVPVVADDSMTAREIAAKTGRGVRQVERWLSRMIEEGRAEFSGIKHTKTATGATYPVRAYRVK